MKNYFSNFSSLLTYDQNGPIDYLDRFDAFEEAYAAVESDAGFILVENFQDRSFRSALNLAGWKPQGDPHAQAVEWWQMDFEYANTPVSACNVSRILSLLHRNPIANLRDYQDVSSQEFTIVNFVSPSSVSRAQPLLTSPELHVLRFFGGQQLRG